MEAYLDNSATTRCCLAATDKMMRVLREDYGNPSSLHNKGMEAENHVRAARRAIAATLRVQEKEIVFTSGGTEANNLAIMGSVRANRRSGSRVITSAIEHPSVAVPFEMLREMGFDVVILPVNSAGVISAEALEEAMTEDTILVSFMMVNNEIGTVQPVERLAQIAKSRNPACVVHADAIQAYGKTQIHPRKAGVDLLSASGHKIHGPKGSGFLYVADRVKIRPGMLGGGQERGLRSGTENVPAIAGLGAAAEEICRQLPRSAERMRELRQLFIAGVAKIPGVTVNGASGEKAAPHIVSVSVADVRSEVLLHALEEKGIYVSAGSACSSNKPAVSATLTAIGMARSLAECTVRISLSVETTEEEIRYAVSGMEELVPILQRFTRH